jgi:uroporphyrinogen decarboxylase
MALGQPLRFGTGEGPRLPPLEDLATLNPEKAPQIYAPIIETVRLVRAGLSPDTALIGFAGAPATVACYMLDGKGSEDDFIRTRTLCYEKPGFVAGLIEILVTSTIAYLQAQIDAGANCVMLFESWSGIFPPAHFRKFVIEPTRNIVAALKAANPGLRIIGFPRLCGLHLGDYVRETGVDAVGLDTVTDPAAAIAACPPGTVFQGNLDPLLLRSGGDALKSATRTLLEAFRGKPHIFNLGHGITPDVPLDHVAELLSVIHEG